MISLKTEEEIKIMAQGGKILANIMEELKQMVRPGITTKELDRVAETLIFKFKGEPSFKGYEGFPATLCTSINEEVVHIIPSNRVLKEGDIISLDIGMKYLGYHTDLAITVPIGTVSGETQRLIRVTKKALKRGIKKVRPGNTFGDIGNTIERYVESQNYKVIRELCGHGIGKEVHEEPQVLNFGKRHTGEEITEGMVFCIEPMVSIGDWRVKKSSTGYGYETKDGSLSCHFEQTIAVDKNGAKILTVI